MRDDRRRLEIKLPTELDQELRSAARKRGFSSANAFVRAAIANELHSGETALDRTEANIAATIDRLTKEIRSLQTAQQGLFALTDTLARLFLTCVPDPPPDMLDQAKAKARLRYERLLLSVAQSMKQHD